MRTIIEQYSKDLTSGRLAYAYDHFCRVYFYAKKLGEQYDDSVLHAASFLYKIILGQTSKEDSAGRAELILSEAGFPVDKIAAVKHAILNSDTEDRPGTVEGKLLHDSIIIDSLGAVGFARFSVGSYFWERSQKISDIHDRYSEYLACIDKNIQLPETREFIKDRLAMSQTIVKRLKEELDEE